MKRMPRFSPFPEIETENLVLRRITLLDAAALFEMRSNPIMHQYTDTKPDEDICMTRMYIDKMNKGIDQDKWVVWAMAHKQSGKVIGTISLWNINLEQISAELGYGIAPDYQGQGLMKEALQRVIKYGFETMDLKAIEAYTEENNLRSNQLLEKCNFDEVGRVKDEGYINNRDYHMVVYRLEKVKQMEL